MDDQHDEGTLCHESQGLWYQVENLKLIPHIDASRRRKRYDFYGHRLESPTFEVNASYKAKLIPFERYLNHR